MDDPLVALSCVLRPTTAAPGLGRRLVRECLGPRRDSRRAELVVSELLTNVVLHTAHPPILRLVPDGALLRIEVEDGGAGSPETREPAGADGGYGLRIVHAVAEHWGVRETPGGKAVWCTLS